MKLAAAVASVTVGRAAANHVMNIHSHTCTWVKMPPTSYDFVEYLFYHGGACEQFFLRSISY
jgi:hypothetical protein